MNRANLVIRDFHTRKPLRSIFVLWVVAREVGGSRGWIASWLFALIKLKTKNYQKKKTNKRIRRLIHFVILFTYLALTHVSFISFFKRKRTKKRAGKNIFEWRREKGGRERERAREKARSKSRKIINLGSQYKIKCLRLQWRHRPHQCPPFPTTDPSSVTSSSNHCSFLSHFHLQPLLIPQSLPLSTSLSMNRIYETNTSKFSFAVMITYNNDENTTNINS